MKISEETSEIIAKVITGDNGFLPICRNGGEVVSFFEECGVKDSFEGTKWRWAKQMLINYNGTDIIDEILTNLFKPQRWLKIETDMTEGIAEVNKYLEYDNYLISTDGKKISIDSLGTVQHENVESIIFAATGPKPDIYLKDTLTGTLGIKANDGGYIIYNHEKKCKQVTWKHLIEWWMKKHGVEFDIASEAILTKLRSSCGAGPEELFFDTYWDLCCETTGAEALALLPQVWYMYDPKNKKERKDEALYVQRIDFMMILPTGIRVIFEIDGREHYSTNVNGTGVADVQKYAKLAECDRNIQLQGHIILRYGGDDFRNEDKIRTTIINDIKSLFKLYKIE